MYGSIFNLKPKKGKREELINHLKIDNEKPDGGLAWYVLDPKDRGHDQGAGKKKQQQKRK